MYYQLVKTANKCIGIVWDKKGKKTKIKKIYLPEAKTKMLRRIKKDFPFVNRKPSKLPGDMERLFSDLYQGKIRKVTWSTLDFSDLTPFAKKVLKQVCRIPRGKVAAYSELAAKIGKPGAVRAVGTVMANNPFPIVIPCHRVICSDGTLGGFGGGLKMKKKMLTGEGVKINSKERISADFRIL